MPKPSTHHFLLAAALLLAPAASHAGELIPNELARRNGMVRAWFSQVQLDPARHSVESASLHDDLLVALTTAGVVHAMDANTGATQWTVRIGNPGYPSLGPAVSKDHIAIVNGSTLFVLDRKDGRELMSKQVGGGVGGGPAISGDLVYVPLFNGRVEGYSIGNAKRAAWYYTSRGRIFQPAVAASESVVWSTDASRLYVAWGSAEGVKFRFDTGSPIVAPATVRAPLVYAGSLGGYVYALNEQSGQQRWRYAAGFPVRNSPVEVSGTLYVATDEPALHAIDAKTGQPRWVAPGVAQFIAASEKRIYCLDRLGGLRALDAKSGAVQARAANRGENTAVLNDQTDRLYIYSRDGLIQCFHEIGSTAPYYHRAKPEGEKPEESSAADATDDEPKKDDEPADPFGGAGDPFGGGDDGGDAPDPFGGGGGDAPDPFGGDAGGDDPFGGGDAPDDPFAGDDPFGS